MLNGNIIDKMISFHFQMDKVSKPKLISSAKTKVLITKKKTRKKASLTKYIFNYLLHFHQPIAH